MHFKFAPCTAIVAAGTKAEVRTTRVHLAADASITLTIESAAIAKISAAGEDKEGAGAEPGFFDDDVACDWYHSIGRGKKSSQGVQAVTDGFGGAAATLFASATTLKSPSTGYTYRSIPKRSSSWSPWCVVY